MELRTYSTFRADFSDDGEFSPKGDIVRPSGRAVAYALSQMLREKGWTVSESTQHSYYGWSFTVQGQKGRIWFLLQGLEDWLLLSQNKSSLLRRMTSASKEEHRTILADLHGLLTNDPRFRDLRWFTKQEYERDTKSPGSPQP